MLMAVIPNPHLCLDNSSIHLSFKLNHCSRLLHWEEVDTLDGPPLPVDILLLDLYPGSEVQHLHLEVEGSQRDWDTALALLEEGGVQMRRVI